VNGYGQDGQVPKTITTAVANRMRTEIRSGVLEPGARLRQAQVAEHYGVSTTPVREAFAMLEREGLLHSIPHRGVVVYQPTSEDLREIYEIRIPLEALATERAVPNLTEDDLAHILDLFGSLVAAEHKGDITLSNELNDQFHTRIYVAADRPRLVALITDLRAASRSYTRLFAETVRSVDQTEAEHRAIYEACAAGAPKRAATAMIKHLRHTVDVVAVGLEQCSELSAAAETVAVAAVPRAPLRR
jgi:DNA-binding GntR family transcriptional regulator